MATITLRVHHRPLRIGFLVEDGNVQQLLRAAELNTGLWGGIFNPIIPVNKDISELERLVKTFRVDLLDPSTKSPQLSTATAKIPWLPWNHLSLRGPPEEGSADALYLAVFGCSGDLGYAYCHSAAG